MNAGITLTGTQIDQYADSMAMRAIAVELTTGMALTGRVSGLEALRRRKLIEGRTTKVAGFRKALKAMRERYPEWEPTPGTSIAKAIEKHGLK